MSASIVRKKDNTKDKIRQFNKPRNCKYLYD